MFRLQQSVMESKGFVKDTSMVLFSKAKNSPKNYGTFLEFESLIYEEKNFC